MATTRLLLGIRMGRGPREKERENWLITSDDTIKMRANSKGCRHLDEDLTVDDAM